MINKANDEMPQADVTPEDGKVDIAHLDVQCHIIITDADTGEIIVNQRG